MIKKKDCWKKQKPRGGSLRRRSNSDRLLGRIFPPRTFEAKREVQFRFLVPWEYTSRWCTRLPQSHTLKITVDWCPWRKEKNLRTKRVNSVPPSLPLSPSSLPLSWRIFQEVSPSNASSKSYRISWNARNDGLSIWQKGRSIDYCHTTDGRSSVIDNPLCVDLSRILRKACTDSTVRIYVSVFLRLI